MRQNYGFSSWEESIGVSSPETISICSCGRGGKCCQMDSMDQVVAVSLDKSQLDSGLKSFCENNIGETITLAKQSH